jgi:hypothetical protein
MFLSQSIKNFLRENFQEQEKPLSNIKKDINQFCLNDDDLGQKLGNDPMFHSLVGNTWHGMFPGDD